MTDNNKKTLYEKLLKISEEVGVLPKRKENGMKYATLSAETAFPIYRELFVENRMIVNVKHHLTVDDVIELTNKGVSNEVIIKLLDTYQSEYIEVKNNKIYQTRVDVEFICVDTGEKITIPVITGNSTYNDKFFAAAVTLALKYSLVHNTIAATEEMSEDEFNYNKNNPSSGNSRIKKEVTPIDPELVPLAWEAIEHNFAGLKEEEFNEKRRIFIEAFSDLPKDKFYIKVAEIIKKNNGTILFSYIYKSDIVSGTFTTDLFNIYLKQDDFLTEPPFSNIGIGRENGLDIYKMSKQGILAKPEIKGKYVLGLEPELIDLD